MKYKGNTSWRIIRTFLFWMIGSMNTIFIRESELGTFKNYLGYFFLLLALIDTVFLVYPLLKSDRKE